MRRFDASIFWSVCVMAALAGRAAEAHPWHRHRPALEAAQSRPAVPPDDADDPSAVDAEPAVAVAAEPRRAGTPFHFVAAAKPRGAGIDIATAFAPFEKLKAISCRRDDRWFYVESSGIPDHPLMVGIRAWQQQVPLPQPYTGDNAWQIPLAPVPAADPASTRDRFLRGAIALAVNGIPIFNPLNNRGEDAFAIGELDELGGHCGRADDYHYHIAPVHLEKVVGKGRPIAWALDGYPIYGYTEPDGAPVKGLDRLGGHADADGNYHYHAQKQYPYLNGGFHGVVTEREGQVDPQPRARGVREALPPLRGARIVAFEEPRPGTRRLTYDIDGRRGTVEYAEQPGGAVAFTFTDPSGRKTSETYGPRGGGDGGRRDRPPPRGDRPPPPRDDRPPRDGGPGPKPAPPTAAARGAAAAELVVSSPAVREGGLLPAEFTCDGAGISPPLEWQAGPRGTLSYAVVIWHEAPDRLKTYWLVHGIPATVTALPKGAKGIGAVGLNDKRRPEYDPMCSKGPGAKTYHATVYALSARPEFPGGPPTREALLAAIETITLAEGTLAFTYDRQAKP